MKSQELSIISKIAALAVSKPHDEGVEGIGDDCAVLPLGEGRNLVVTSDTMTEGSHFLFEKSAPKLLAYKAVASNVSDVISMGAKPKYLFLALTFTPQWSEVWIDDFVEGMGEACEEFGITILGGDTTKSKLATTINITLMGEVATENLRRRNMAQVGDTIAILAPLGGSSAGLKLLLEGNLSHPLAVNHFRPTIFASQAQWLASQSATGAMMDISDGIAKDLRHILSASNVGAKVNLEALPISSDTQKICSSRGWDSISLALEGGEEYAPLVTIRKGQFDVISSHYKSLFGLTLYNIGIITEESGKLRWFERGVESRRNFKGFTH